jgi:hypothetical protein
MIGNTEAHIDKVISVGLMTPPTTALLSVIWPWQHSDDTVAELHYYGGYPIEMVLLTGEYPGKGDIGNIAKPGVQVAIMYKPIKHLMNDCRLRVVGFEDGSLWEVMTDFYPDAYHDWSSKTRIEKAKKLLPRGAWRGYFLQSLQGENLGYHQARFT